MNILDFSSLVLPGPRGENYGNCTQDECVLKHYVPNSTFYHCSLQCVAGIITRQWTPIGVQDIHVPRWQRTFFFAENSFFRICLNKICAQEEERGPIQVSY